MRAQNQITLRDEPAALSALQPMLPGAATAPTDHAEPSLIKAVLRHFWLVLVFAAVGGSVAGLYLMKARPLFVSECKLYIEPSGPRVLTETLGSAQRSNYLYTQAALIQSTPILQMVA